ncbi:hypothetical protein CEUSTIGMA_g9353.t1 [Chlamydomonas eustigma]|uniref:Uncharacterized protein n=1 Tax=Chlamydomonas eustigma TaxID=1157962 RepID=A0A250XFR7_9CHLO|nr:hypothetical protein CEUSTIGMA_g9353.t1 [Chlamydomonas eustigma]|eukprot:GAX81925.1 hypothetical protein CEUSTIGMA_g9353.t1 [Chlamydomonas eustigma]
MVSVIIPDIPTSGGLVHASIDLSLHDSAIFVDRIKDLVTKLAEHRKKTNSSRLQNEGGSKESVYKQSSSSTSAELRQGDCSSMPKPVAPISKLNAPTAVATTHVALQNVPGTLPILPTAANTHPPAAAATAMPAAVRPLFPLPQHGSKPMTPPPDTFSQPAVQVPPSPPLPPPQVLISSFPPPPPPPKLPPTTLTHSIPQTTAMPVPVPATSQQLPAGSIPPRPAAVWRWVYQSDPMEHNSDPVHSMAYTAQIDGLPQGDGHGGWLISSSRNMLNLWECNMGGGPSLPSVIMMHSQQTDFLSSSLTIESGLQMLLAASAETVVRPGVNPTECVSLHCLSAERGILAYKYRMVLPDHFALKPGQPPQQQKQLTRRLTKVVSLHSLGRNLRGCLACAYGPRVLVYETHEGLTASANINRPRHDWVASGSSGANITALHAAGISGLLFSGGADGTVAIWNIRDRTNFTTPSLALRQQSSQPKATTAAAAVITSIQQLSEHRLAVAGGGGSGVALWDLRSPSAPLQHIVPDNTPVLNMKTSPEGNSVAIVTGKGLYSAELREGGVGALSLIADAAPPPQRPGVQQQVPKPPLDVEWNWNTGELYACGLGGVINVYRRR